MRLLTRMEKAASLKMKTLSTWFLSAALTLTAIPLNARQPVHAKNGMAVAMEANAADVGIQVLKSGGNAVDAAVAMGSSIRSGPRNAALTASAFGNTSATSGSRTTTFEFACSRATYVPRTSARNSDRLYFRPKRILSDSLSLLHRSPSPPALPRGRDDSNRAVLFRVGHHQKAPRGRHTKRHETPLFERMIGVTTRCRQGIKEYARGFVEGYAVFPQVPGSL